MKNGGGERRGPWLPAKRRLETWGRTHRDLFPPPQPRLCVTLIRVNESIIFPLRNDSSLFRAISLLATSLYVDKVCLYFLLYEQFDK